MPHRVHAAFSGSEQLQQACAKGLLTEQQVQEALRQQAVPAEPLPAIAPAAPTAPPSHVPPLHDAAMDDALEWTGSFDLERMAAEIDAGALPDPSHLQKSVFGSGNLHIEDDVLLLDTDLGNMGDDVLLQLVEMH